MTLMISSKPLTFINNFFKKIIKKECLKKFTSIFGAKDGYKNT